MSPLNSTWQTYPINGDAKQLDKIAESQGFIPLGNEDIIEVLSTEGENYVVSDTDPNFGEAFTKAIKLLPCEMDKVNYLLIDFLCGSKQPEVSDLTAITSSLAQASTDISVKWGVAADDSIGDDFKVIIVASIK